MTNKLLTLGEHSVELKGFLTGGDWENIQDAMIGSMEIDPKDPKPTLQGSALKKFNAAKVEAAVVSVDLSTENIVETVRAFPAKLYQDLLAEIDKLMEDSEGKGSAPAN